MVGKIVTAKVLETVRETWVLVKGLAVLEQTFVEWHTCRTLSFPTLAMLASLERRGTMSGAKQ